MANPKDLIGAKKAPLGLVPPALIIGAAEAMENGASKYGPFNWRDYPVQAMTYVEAALRHLLAYVDGEDDAPDTGIHHVKHAIAGLGILLDSLEGGQLIDNRPKPGPAAKMMGSLDRSAPTLGLPIAPSFHSDVEYTEETFTPELVDDGEGWGLMQRSTCQRRDEPGHRWGPPEDHVNGPCDVPGETVIRTIDTTHPKTGERVIRFINERYR